MADFLAVLLKESRPFIERIIGVRVLIVLVDCKEILRFGDKCRSGGVRRIFTRTRNSVSL